MEAGTAEDYRSAENTIMMAITRLANRQRFTRFVATDAEGVPVNIPKQGESKKWLISTIPGPKQPGMFLRFLDETENARDDFVRDIVDNPKVAMDPVFIESLKQLKVKLSKCMFWKFRDIFSTTLNFFKKKKLKISLSVSNFWFFWLFQVKKIEIQRLEALLPSFSSSCYRYLIIQLNLTGWRRKNLARVLPVAAFQFLYLEKSEKSKFSLPVAEELGKSSSSRSFLIFLTWKIENNQNLAFQSLNLNFADFCKSEKLKRSDWKDSCQVLFPPASYFVYWNLAFVLRFYDFLHQWNMSTSFKCSDENVPKFRKINNLTKDF